MASLRILAIDDDEVMRQIIQLSLAGHEQYDVTVCENGEQLLSLARELQPDLLLMDVTMPDRSGPELLQNLQEADLCPNASVIFLTGSDDSEEVLCAQCKRVLGVIHKPFVPTELAARVQALCNRA